MSLMHRRGNALLGMTLLVSLACLSAVNPAQAFSGYRWNGSVNSDLLTDGNYDVWNATTSTWDPYATVPTSDVDFMTLASDPNPNPTVSGTWTLLYLEFYDESNAALTDPVPGRTFSGTGTITISANGNLDSGNATSDVTFSNADLRLTRAAQIYSGGMGVSTANLIINTGALHMGVGGSSGSPLINAVGANITINPAVDFTASTSNRILSLVSNTGRTITLNDGVVQTTRLVSVDVNGQAGGLVVMSSSHAFNTTININSGDLQWKGNTGYDGVFNMYNGNLLLDSTSTFLGGYAENWGGSRTNVNTQYTGAVKLSGGVNTTEGIWLGGRLDSNPAPNIISVSGNNTLGGIYSDHGGWAAGNNMRVSSEGAAPGDFLTISGGIYLGITGLYRSGTIHATSGAGNMIFEGAGNGAVDNGVVEGDPVNWQWSIVKKDAGTWTLKGTTLAPVAWSGNTTVSGGTLILNGTATLGTGPTIDLQAGQLDVSLTTAGGMTLAGTQTLKGVGTVVGNLANTSGSIIAPGNSGAGTFNVTGNLSLVDGGIMAYELSNNPVSGANDKTAVTGNLSLAGTTTINLTQTDGSLGVGSYRLLDYTGTLTGGGSINIPGVTGGLTRTPVSIQTSVAHQVNLVVSSGGGPQTYVWGHTGTDYNWTIGATGANDWTSTDQKFFNGDIVSFDDTGKNASSIALSSALGALLPASLTFTNNSKSYTFNGAGAIGTIVNPVPLVLNGTGTTVTFANGAENHFSTISTTAGGTLAFNQSVDITVANLSGGGDLHQNSTHTLTLAGDNSNYYGNIYVNAGTLKVGSATATGASNSNINVASGATLDTNSINLNPNWTVHVQGTGMGGLGAIVNNNNVTAPAGDSITRVVLDGDTTISATLTGNWWYTTTMDATNPAGGGFTLTKIGDYETGVGGYASGTIPGANETNIGNLNVEGGSFYLWYDTAIDAQPGTVHLSNGGQLNFGLNVVGASISKPIVVDATGGGMAFYRPPTGGMNVYSTVQLDGNLILATNGQANYNSAISGNGGVTVVASPWGGTDKIVFAADNSYLGTTTIDAGGTLQVGNGGTTGSLGAGALTDNGTLAINLSGTHSTTSLIPNDHVIAGSGGVTFLASDGVFTLDQDNTYSGVTTINFGTVILKTNGGLGPGSYTSILDNAGNTPPATGVLQLDGSAGNLTVAENFRTSGTGNATTNGCIQNVAGDNVMTGQLLLISGGGNTTVNVIGGSLDIQGPVTTNINGGRVLFLDGAVGTNGKVSGIMADGTGTQVLNLVKFGAGTWTLTNANTYAGFTEIDEGKLILAPTGQIGSTTIYNDAVFQIDGGTHTLGAVIPYNPGMGGMYVLGDSDVTLPSITQDTLQIGGAAPSASAAVPEPGTLLLSAIGGGLCAMFLRRKAA